MGVHTAETQIRRTSFGVRWDFVLGEFMSCGAFSLDLNANDSHVAARSSDKTFDVVWVACKNHRFVAKRDGHHNGVNYIHSSGLTEKPSCFVRLAFAKGNDHAPG